MTPKDAPADTVTVSATAAKYVAFMREKQGTPSLMLRVTVLGGGCSGFKYQLDFDAQKQADDVTFGDVLVTDETSLPFLANAVIDYEQTLMGSRFKIKNPNAAASCGCGNSFAAKM